MKGRGGGGGLTDQSDIEYAKEKPKESSSKATKTMLLFFSNSCYVTVS